MGAVKPLVTCAYAAAVTPVVRALARRWGAVAQPRQDRYHQQPTALFGGVAIFMGFVASYLLQWPPVASHIT